MTNDETERALVQLHKAGILEQCSLKEYRSIKASHARYALSLRTPHESHTLKSADDVQALVDKWGTKQCPTSSRTSGFES